MRDKLTLLVMFSVAMLVSCTRVTESTTTTPIPTPVTATGIIVLCNSGAASGLNTAAVVVGNLQPNPIVEIPVVIDPGYTPAQVCQAINTAAISAGWKTDLSDPNSTGLLIYGPSDKIDLTCKNITLQFKTFGGGQTGPATDCAPMPITQVLVRDPKPIDEPCPLSTPCRFIEIITPDGVNGTISVLFLSNELKAFIRRNAQTLINANLPSNLTSTNNGLPGVQYRNGRVTIQQATFDGVTSTCGDQPFPPCMPLPTNALTLQLTGIYEKDQYVLNFGGYKEKGWITIGTFVLPVKLAFSIDSQAALPAQNLQATSAETTATVTMSVIFPGTTLPIAVNQTQTVNIPLVDATTLSQYPFLNTLSIKSLAVTKIDSGEIIVGGTFGAPPATSRHR